MVELMLVVGLILMLIGGITYVGYRGRLDQKAKQERHDNYIGQCEATRDGLYTKDEVREMWDAINYEKQMRGDLVESGVRDAIRKKTGIPASALFEEMVNKRRDG
jgi:hypothetical protein